MPQKAEPVWQVWLLGVPDLCCEILSPSDTEKQTLEEKLDRFHAMGVAEVVAFDVAAPRGTRVRAWDLVSGDLVERIVEGDATPCLTLGLWFVVAPAEVTGIGIIEALRLAEDPAGRRLVPTPLEHERAGKDAALAGQERERADKERERADKERERAEKDAALTENARLRAELAAHAGGRGGRRRRRS